MKISLLLATNRVQLMFIYKYTPTPGSGKSSRIRIPCRICNRNLISVACFSECLGLYASSAHNAVSNALSAGPSQHHLLSLTSGRLRLPSPRNPFIHSDYPTKVWRKSLTENHLVKGKERKGKGRKAKPSQQASKQARKHARAHASKKASTSPDAGGGWGRAQRLPDQHLSCHQK